MAGFKARARALDMLGRQQIAGVPTAISELFKNAHDAYADHVIVDYYRSDRLFVMRDDGVGMTCQEFEERWLTLGTESKLNHRKSQLPPIIKNKKLRPVMGEKGIGRLAIASIGDHVLVLTRAIREDENGEVIDELVVSFVYWRLFEIPGLDLDQVVVPLKAFEGGYVPNEDDVNELLLPLKENINQLLNDDYITKKEYIELNSRLVDFKVDPSQIQGYFGDTYDVDNISFVEPLLNNEKSGTWFIINPADSLLEVSIDDNSEDRSSPLLKALLGFANTMIPDTDSPEIKVSFRDHKTEDYFEDHIAENNFWTPVEFKSADHQIYGEIDEFGQFQGDINVYGKEFKNHSIIWNGNKGHRTSCGPFSLKFAYIQGEKHATSLPLDEWALISEKLKKNSGLYLYKDGIRILPYGDNSYDFLDIELRRNKGAGYYFFSYRRMFGTIEISKDRNIELIEKAGREGLRENKAYKEFRDILKHVFVQLANDFFRDGKRGGGLNAEYWEQKKGEFEKLYKAREEFEKRARNKKVKFQKDLDIWFTLVQSGDIEQRYKELTKVVKGKLDYCLSIGDKDYSSELFLSTETETHEVLNKIRDSYKIIRPKGVALSKNISEDYELYLERLQELDKEVFSVYEQQIYDLIESYHKKLNAEINRRKRLERAINTTINRYKKETKVKATETTNVVSKLNQDVVDLAKDLRRDYELKIKKVQAQLARIEPNKIDDFNLVEERSRLETDLIEEANKIRATLENIRYQLDGVVISKDFNKDFTKDDVSVALAEELDILKEKVDADIELSQLGLAVSAIQHEFQHTTGVLRKQVRRLKAWADVNDGLDTIYSTIRTNFEHLENYLTLFMPLSRRLYRKKVEIVGADIYEFVREVFWARIAKDRHNISIESTKAFNTNILMGYPSTFYPVFVNLIDNAIFWLKDQNYERVIKLDVRDNAMYISNNGPEIDIRDHDRIFELGFSKKPSGRGMGLYISKEVLNKMDYDICLVKPELEKGVTFRIFPIEQK
ncbi:MAG: ATP-binding protein [Bacteroidales bacterium]|jgi:signal transduction histidine kinase|nr:ATP-binding protein [Bacteroidales bacterium]